MSKIVVLLSTYNGEKYLREQIDSILNQTGSKDISIFVRDDGSTDNTVNILQEYRNKGLLNFYCGKNIGFVRSFFDLLFNAPNADFYAFADQDDYWLPNKIEFGISKIKNFNKPALFCHKKKIVDEKLNYIGFDDISPKKDILYNFLFHNAVSGCTILFNKKLYDKLILYSKLIETCKNKFLFHDELIYKTALFLGEVIYSKEELMLYRQHFDNCIGSRKEKNFLLKPDFATFGGEKKASKSDFYSLRNHFLMPQKCIIFCRLKIITLLNLLSFSLISNLLSL